MIHFTLYKSQALQLQATSNNNKKKIEAKTEVVNKKASYSICPKYLSAYLLYILRTSLQCWKAFLKHWIYRVSNSQINTSERHFPNKTIYIQGSTLRIFSCFSIRQMIQFFTGLVKKIWLV